ncbi:MAG: hypothetical protein IT383_09650 [Deltaproteobacteria bacterium]|nr:hypothetical protein [Deltaproteobacteria bacterium]
MITRYLVPCALGLLTALVAEPAAAYRPPARLLLQKSMERQGERGTKTLQVEAETQLFDAAGAARGPAFAERLLFQAPGSMRRESELPEGTRVELRVDDKTSLRQAGQADKSGKAAVDLLFDLVTAAPPLDPDRAVERMLRDLKLIGVNPEVVSFARFDGRIAYLIGSKPWEADKPQLWLDKDTLLVTRVVMVQKGEGAVVKRTDVRYLGWGSPIGGVWFPSSIEVWVEDKLVRRTSVSQVDRNVAFDATLFQIK